jgi:hypothetical protein
MAINFPNSPSTGDIFSDPTSGFSYRWTGSVWENFNYADATRIQELDDISSSFNGSTTTFALTSSSTAVTVGKASQLLINIGGVTQNPATDYTVSGSNITFTTAPDSGLDFYGVKQGDVANVSTAKTSQVRPDSLTTGGPRWNASGDVLVSGAATIANTGSASTALYVSGGARITGILTVGSSSVILDGSDDTISVGSDLTVTSSGITVGIITGVFYGDGSTLENVGVGTTGSLNTTGIVTAASFFGDGSGLTNVGGALDPISFTPGIGATEVFANTTIAVQFNKPIVASAGTITLRTNAADGTILESFDVGTSSSISISGGTLTVTPTDTLGAGTTHFLVFPASVFDDTFESSSNTGISTYSFITQAGDPPGRLFSWGYGTYGGAMTDERIMKSSPTQVPGTQWTFVYSNYLTSHATKSDGTLWWSGYGVYGNPINSRISYSSPVQVPGTQWKTTLSGSYLSHLAAKTDGTLWGWGRSTNGEIPNNAGGASNYISSPVQIPGTTWNIIADTPYDQRVGGATKTDGTLWTWGYNRDGSLGLGNRLSYSSPAQVPGTQWEMNTNQFTIGYHSAAIKSDGTLWSWGYNNNGQLGHNSLVRRSSPTQVPGTQWETVNMGTYSAMGTKTDGTLWMWGYNSNGILGLNNAIYYSSPVQLPGTAWDVPVMAFNTASCTKTDGTLWTWGVNDYGQIGNNAYGAPTYSSPIQVPGTEWSRPAGKVYNKFAIKQ